MAEREAILDESLSLDGRSCRVTMRVARTDPLALEVRAAVRNRSGRPTASITCYAPVTPNEHHQVWVGRTSTGSLDVVIDKPAVAAGLTASLSWAIKLGADGQLVSVRRLPQ